MTQAPLGSVSSAGLRETCSAAGKPKPEGLRDRSWAGLRVQDPRRFGVSGLLFRSEV